MLRRVMCLGKWWAAAIPVRACSMTHVVFKQACVPCSIKLVHDSHRTVDPEEPGRVKAARRGNNSLQERRAVVLEGSKWISPARIHAIKMRVIIPKPRTIYSTGLQVNLND